MLTVPWGGQGFPTGQGTAQTAVGSHEQGLRAEAQDLGQPCPGPRDTRGPRDTQTGVPVALSLTGVVVGQRVQTGVSEGRRSPEHRRERSWERREGEAAPAQSPGPPPSPEEPGVHAGFKPGAGASALESAAKASGPAVASAAAASGGPAAPTLNAIRAGTARPPPAAPRGPSQLPGPRPSIPALAPGTDKPRPPHAGGERGPHPECCVPGPSAPSPCACASFNYPGFSSRASPEMAEISGI